MLRSSFLKAGRFPEDSIPPFSFWRCQKRMGRGRSKRKKRLRRTGGPHGPPVRVRGGRANRCSGHRWPRRPWAGPCSLRGAFPHNDCGGWTGWLSDLIRFSFRAFRFTRKGYAASVRQQSCQRLRSCCALPRRSLWVPPQTVGADPDPPAAFPASESLPPGGKVAFAQQMTDEGDPFPGLFRFLQRLPI